MNVDRELHQRVGARALWRGLRCGAVAALVAVGLTGWAPGAGASTVWVVTTTADVIDPGDGVLSLREAISSANGDGDSSEVVLEGGSTYALSRCGPPENANQRGDLDLTQPVVIRSSSTALATITTSCPERHIDYLTTSGALDLRSIILTNGRQPVPGAVAGQPLPSELGGGSVQSKGRVTAVDSVFLGNSTFAAVADGTQPDGSFVFGAHGGAILAPRTILTRSRVIANRADRGGGVAQWASVRSGISLVDSSLTSNVAIWGGGVIGSATALRSTFAANVAHVGTTQGSSGGGGAVYGDVVADSSTFTGNRTDGYGGHLAGSGSFTRSRMQGGEAGVGGAAFVRDLAMRDTVVEANKAELVGGIEALAGFVPGDVATVRATRSVFRGNTSTHAGLGAASAIDSVGLVELTGSIVEGNSAVDGPALRQRTPAVTYCGQTVKQLGLRLDRSQVSGNSGAGAVLADGDPLTGTSCLDGTTFVRNSTLRHGSGADAVLTTKLHGVLDHATLISDSKAPALRDLASPGVAGLVLGRSLASSEGATACDLADTGFISWTLSPDVSCWSPGAGNQVLPGGVVDDDVPFSVMGSTVAAPRVGPAWADHIPIPQCSTVIDQVGAVRPQGSGCSPGAIERSACEEQIGLHAPEPASTMRVEGARECVEGGWPS